VENYKFKSLRTYSSDEWMINTSKKFRKVFDRAEIAYVRCELSFYNKLFDRQDWSCNVTLKCFGFENEKREELCSLESVLEVKKDEPIASIRDGWGNAKEGAYWKKGEYFWQAFIDGELAGETKFMVNTIGKVTSENNPYFDVEYIKLYVGDYNAFNQVTPHYVENIIRETTQYVWVKAKLKNKPEERWDYELIFNFLDHANQLKGQVRREGHIERDKMNYTYAFDVGWGNDEAGTWKGEKYKVEIVFMDVVVGTLAFTSTSENEKEIPQPISNSAERSPILSRFRKILGWDKQ
jgi:hypothetical protein